MNMLITLPLVNWFMGAVIIGVFALVCIIMAVVVFNMARGNSGQSKLKE